MTMAKTFLLLATLIGSVSAMAKTYQCEIGREALGPGINMDLTFEIHLNDNSESYITILGDKVSVNCERPDENTVSCRDAEGMPHTARVLSDTEATLEIGRGMFLPETDASCSLKTQAGL